LLVALSLLFAALLTLLVVLLLLLLLLALLFPPLLTFLVVPLLLLTTRLWLLLRLLNRLFAATFDRLGRLRRLRCFATAGSRAFFAWSLVLAPLASLFASPTSPLSIGKVGDS